MMKRSHFRTIFCCTFLSYFALLSSCNIFINSSSSSSSSSSSFYQPEYLQEYYRDYFDIGAAVQYQSIDSKKYDDLMPHFSTLTAENDMKWGKLEASRGVLTFENADKIVNYATSNNKKVRGHVLTWYKSLPTWVKNACVDKQTTLDILDKHIKEVMQHFGNNIYCYDVVNEALRNSITTEQLNNDDIYRTGGSDFNADTTTDFYSICGFDYIAQSFKSAAEAKKLYGLDNIKLYYNDYSLNNPNKRNAAIKLIKKLQDANIEIDGIGMQAHYRLSSYLADKDGFMNDFEQSIKEFTALGIDVQITELDIRTYDNSTDASKYDSLPSDVEHNQAEMFERIYEICRKYSLPHQSFAGIITNVTTWGIADDHNAHDSSAHKEFPLLFNADHSKKEAYELITNFIEE